MAVPMMRPGASKSLTESYAGTAWPPKLSISLHTWAAGLSSTPRPSRLAPTSLTTSFAPSRARHSANSRPMPRPAPVTTATLSESSMGPTLVGRLCHLRLERPAVELLHRGERQRIDDPQLLGELVRREAARRELAEVVERGSGALVAGHDHSHAHLSHDGVGP